MVDENGQRGWILRSSISKTDPNIPLSKNYARSEFFCTVQNKIERRNKTILE
jgi:hypothetical protein